MRDGEGERDGEGGKDGVGVRDGEGARDGGGVRDGDLHVPPHGDLRHLFPHFSTRYNSLTALGFYPFVDRINLDAVENIPTYVEQTCTFAIAVTSNLFASYWCAVELCTAIKHHAAGILNILLVPIQGESWSDLLTGERNCTCPVCVRASRARVSEGGRGDAAW